MSTIDYEGMEPHVFIDWQPDSTGCRRVLGAVRTAALDRMRDTEDPFSRCLRIAIGCRYGDLVRMRETRMDAMGQPVGAWRVDDIPASYRGIAERWLESKGWSGDSTKKTRRGKVTP